jgi:GNAT superfamily N-acetyltransferase
MPRTNVEIRSLLAATDVDVLPDTSLVVDRGEYVVVRTPTNPTYHWGNFLLWRRPPEAGDRARWEAAFLEEFGGEQRGSRHVSLCWDVPGEDGAALEEFVAVGYEADRGVALVAEPDDLVDHPRACVDAQVRALDPDGDEEMWAAVLELQVASREPNHPEEYYRTFVTARMADRRARFRAGDGAWFVALLDGEVAGSCGVVVTQGRARYQAVDTAPAFRRRGVASRLVVEAGRHAVSNSDARQLVIGADAEYHALPLYESLGFTVRERCLAVCWWPGAEDAGRHPQFGRFARTTA